MKRPSHLTTDIETILFRTEDSWTLADIRVFARSLDGIVGILSSGNTAAWLRGVHLSDVAVAQGGQRDLVSSVLAVTHPEISFWNVRVEERWFFPPDVGLDVVSIRMASPGHILIGGGMARLVRAIRGLLEAWWSERRRRRHEDELRALEREKARWEHEIARLKFVRRYLREAGNIVPGAARNQPEDFISEAEAIIAGQLAQIDLLVEKGKLVDDTDALRRRPVDGDGWF
jgi:hypothetical protein